MPKWQGSSRRDRLPPDWPKIRARILKRDHNRCQWVEDDRKCLQWANEVDHKIPNDDNSDRNLQSLCHAHHQAKSSTEGAAALAKKKWAIKNRFKRSEGHPGLL